MKSSTTNKQQTVERTRICEETTRTYIRSG